MTTGLKFGSRQSKTGNISTQALPTSLHDVVSTIFVGPSVIQNAVASPATLAAQTISTLYPVGPLPALTNFGDPTTLITPSVRNTQVIQIPTKSGKTTSGPPGVTITLSPPSFALSNFGISNIRPEILTVVDYQPIFKSNTINLTTAGKLIDVSYQSRILREETLKQIISDMDNSTFTKSQLAAVLSDYSKALDSTKNIIDFYSNAVNDIKIIKDNFDIKAISAEFFNTPHFLTLKDFFTQKMLFSPVSFNIFSDTKIFYQLLFDLKQTIEHYSFSLLNLNDNFRILDRDPTVINKTIQNTNFSFTVDTIKSNDVVTGNALEASFFSTFLNSLPTDVDDKIKLLLTVLSKEIRVSRGLADEHTKNTLKDFGLKNAGSPFNEIIGIVGEDIFSKPIGINSIAKLGSFDFNTQTIIFPFENKYIEKEHNTTYVPGSKYFVDTMLEVVNNKFNTGPIIDYVTNFSSKIKGINTLFDKLFDLRNNTSSVVPSVIFRKIATSIKYSTVGLVNARALHEPQSIVSALFKLAMTDPALRQMLFEFLCLSGITTSTTTNQKKIFKRLVTEINGDIRVFPHLIVSGRPDLNNIGNGDAIKPYIEALAARIQNQVFSTIYGTNRPPFTGSAINKQVSGGVDLNPNAIKDIVKSSLFATTIASTNLIKEFIDLANAIDESAMIDSGNESYITEEGKTRYNNLTTSTTLLVLYEIFINFINKYTFSTFTRNGDGGIRVNTDAVSTAWIYVILTNFADIRADAPRNLPTESGTAPINQIVEASNAVGQFAANNGINVTPAGNAVLHLLFPIVSQAIDNARTRNDAAQQATTDANAAQIQRELQNASDNSLLAAESLLPDLGGGIPSSITALQNSLSNIKTKISDEDLTISNFLHFLTILSTRLDDSRTKAINFFSSEKLASIKTLLGNANPSVSAIDQLQTMTTPEQVRTSVYLYDKTIGRTTSLATTLTTAFLPFLLPNNSSQPKITNGDNGTLSKQNSNSVLNLKFLKNSVIDKNTKNSLFALLSENDFRETELGDSRIKLMTIGIPSGMSKKLVEKIRGASIGQESFANKQFDLISINIYKRSVEHENLVFKPQKFIFDLSLFPSITPLTVNSGENFDNIIDNTSFVDYENPLFPQNVILSDINNNSKYDFLSSTQKRVMIKNHVISNLLNSYTTLLTNIKISEESFIQFDIPSHDFLTNRFRELVATYLKKVKGVELTETEIAEISTGASVNISKLISENPEGEKILKLVKLISFGNILFQPDLLAHKILSPKAFDRVFTIPVDIETFEVDSSQTASTQSGRATTSITETFLTNPPASTGGQGRRAPPPSSGTSRTGISYVSAPGYRLPLRHKEDIIFEDYLVNIELIG